MESKGSGRLKFTIQSSEKSPLVNPAFVIGNYNPKKVTCKVNGEVIPPEKECRIGRSYDTDGRPQMVLWLKLLTEEPMTLEIIGKK